MKAPFPWYGGKRMASALCWERWGDVGNYVDPFCGSNAPLLERPHEPRAETVNDRDCYVANFWRCFSELRNNPKSAAWREVAQWADWPVNEADMHARHKWLVEQTEFRERIMTDPHFCDTKIAGWWVWGISQWIGGEWCKIGSQWQGRVHVGRGGQGIHRKRPLMKRGGFGIQRVGLTNGKPPRSRPVLDRGGRGISADALDDRTAGLYEYFEAIAHRMRRVRVCCGDWRRVLTATPTTAVGLTAVLLDPPYSDEADRDPGIYSTEDLQVAKDAAQWARENGENPLLRIALCGLEGEHDMPGWDCVAWTAGGSSDNRSRERIWFSPHCLSGIQRDLFTATPPRNNSLR